MKSKDGSSNLHAVHQSSHRKTSIFKDFEVIALFNQKSTAELKKCLMDLNKKQFEVWITTRNEQIHIVWQ